MMDALEVGNLLIRQGALWNRHVLLLACVVTLL
jgi:hypothetical protein